MYAHYWTGSSNLFIDNSKFLSGTVGLFLIINSSNVHVTITNSVFSHIVNGITIHFEVITGNFMEMSNTIISNNDVGLYIQNAAQVDHTTS